MVIDSSLDKSKKRRDGLVAGEEIKLIEDETSKRTRGD